MHDGLKYVDHLRSNIKIIYNIAGNTLINQHSDINRTIRILKDESLCELIVTSDLFMTASARWSDLILPAASVLELSLIHICAQYQGLNTALWAQATLQGRIAGTNAAGRTMAYHGSDSALRCV